MFGTTPSKVKPVGIKNKIFTFTFCYCPNTTHFVSPWITCNLRKMLLRISEMLGKGDKNVRLPRLCAKKSHLVEKVLVFWTLK